jgi:hypothetical protein
MQYKGYSIIAEVSVNEQWEFEETDQGIRLTGFIDNGGADESGIEDFLVLDENGDYPDWATDNYTTVEEAKAAIDKETA